MKSHLIICTRYPVAGESKTRLIPELGAEAAAALQKQMTEKIVREAQNLTQHVDYSFSICYAGGSHEEMTHWLGNLDFFPQIEGDIGMRMEGALRQKYGEGFNNIVLVGSDIPAIDSYFLYQAFTSFHGHDAVIGSSQDGGYYLIGMKDFIFSNVSHSLFHGIPWSTDKVFPLTMDALLKRNIATKTLPTLSDIDTYQDYLFAKKQGQI